MSTALARTTDPSTSHAAARGIEASGHAWDQRAMCLAEVRRLPGQTAAEIASNLGLERHVPSRRLPELRGDGLVKNGGKRTCCELGTTAITWWPV